MEWVKHESKPKWPNTCVADNITQLSCVDPFLKKIRWMKIIKEL